MSDVPIITCEHCTLTFPETSLSYQHFHEERCPGCHQVLRRGESWGGVNVTVAIAEDVAAIDNWLSDYSISTNSSVSSTFDEHTQTRTWELTTDFPWLCEVVYQQSKLCYCQVRFTTVGADNTLDYIEEIFLACANRGLQAYVVSHQDIVEQTKIFLVGAVRHFDTEHLAPELFRPVFRQLDSALKAIAQLFR